MLYSRKLIFFTTITILLTLTLNVSFILGDDYQFDRSDAFEEERFLNISPPDAPSCYPDFITAPVRELHQELFEKSFNLLLNKGLFFNEENSLNSTPSNFIPPHKLMEIFNFTLGEVGESQKDLLNYLEKVIEFSPKPSHPLHLAKYGGGIDPYALAGEWLSVTVNTIPLTYYMAPVHILMELSMTKKLRNLIGYSSGEGIPVPGSSVGNIMAVQMALFKKFPQLKQEGFFKNGQKIVPDFAIFVSEGGSSAFEKSQIFAGFPQSSLVKISVDKNERMNITDLVIQIEKSVQNGIVPLMVIATAGTPFLGAIDSIDEISEITQKYNSTLHVDATNAGPLIFSKKYKNKLAGIENSDTVVWGSDTLLGTPFVTSFLLTREDEGLRYNFGLKATYVFLNTSLYNTYYDRGDSTIQTSRRPEIIKTWLSWKSKGVNGFGAHIEAIYENIDFLIQEMKKPRKGLFKPYINSFDTPTVSFNYIPSEILALFNSNSTETQNQFTNALNNSTLEIKKKLTLEKLVDISLTRDPKLKNSPVLIKLKLTNSAIKKSHLVYILNLIEAVGENLQLPNRSDDKNVTFPYFVSAPIENLHKKFYIELFQSFLRKGLFFQHKRKEAPYLFKGPEELSGIFEFNLGEEPVGHDKLLEDANKIIKYTPHIAHPYFLYQLKAGGDPYSVIADYVGVALNSPMTSYESSPLFTLMEKEVVKEMSNLVGYPHGDGVVNDGGSFSNMVAMAVGKYTQFNKTKTEGNSGVGRSLVMYMSQDAHYSFKKGAFSQGIGLNNVVLVKVDKRGRMIPSELRNEILKTIGDGKVPFFVAATAGATILGSIDPLDEISSICKEFKLWFHIDGVYGGAIIFSKNQKYRLKGIEKSDSFGLNFHKMFGGATTMSILVSRHEGIFKKALGLGDRIEKSDFYSADRDLLYDRELYDEEGEKQIQMTKKANVLKMWFMWKAKGTSGLGQHIDYAYKNAEYLLSLIKKAEDKFQLLMPEFDLVNICFYYVPKRLRNVAKDENYWKELDLIAPQLYSLLPKLGVLNVVAQNQGRGDVTFLKLPLLSSGITFNDLEYMLKLIDFHGQHL